MLLHRCSDCAPETSVYKTAVAAEKINEKVLKTVDANFALMLMRIFQSCSIVINYGRETDVRSIVNELSAQIAAKDSIFSCSLSETILRDKLRSALLEAPVRNHDEDDAPKAAAP